MLPNGCPPRDGLALRKTSLRLKNADDFGDWPVILSARAQKDLQDTKQADGATFQVTVEKIK